MSSTRIALASCVLAVALGAGSWGAVQAFPFYASAQLPPQPPAAPPRDPLSPAAYHRLATEYFQKIYLDASLTDDQRLELVLKALAAEDRALELKPDYAEAMLFKAALLPMRANLTADPSERDRLLAQATELRRKAMALRPPPPPPGHGQGAQVEIASAPAPPMPEEFERHAKELMAVRVGGNLKQPSKVRDVKPVYPPIAQQAKVQGVVILEVLIDTDGTVTDTRVLRSIPLLDQAALESVQQWKFAPSQLNGIPQAVMMTVTVNFTLQ